MDGRDTTSSPPLVEVNFDGIVGPTHNFAGLSHGNVASTKNEGSVSSPRAAALEGLAKMRALSYLGIAQAVLPPQPRPSLSVLRALGFTGSDEAVLARVNSEEPHLLRLVSSASAMWAANAATVAPSTDTSDGRLHLVPANLATMFHRAIEATTTRDILRAIFRDERRFVVHDPLPSTEQWSDEGAANHTRLETSRGVSHIFAWGRRAYGGSGPSASHYPARQTYEASNAVARLLMIDEARALFPQQSPEGIDGGAFHTDVLAVGHRSLFMMHELAFVESAQVEAILSAQLSDELQVVRASSAELPLADAVQSYAFNSQIVSLPPLVPEKSQRYAIVAPKESEANPQARAFLERVVASGNVERVLYLDVRQSMRNGGGPACLRLRVQMTEAELRAIEARVVFDTELDRALTAWVKKNYREELHPSDLADPSLHRESFTALDELTTILSLGAVYDFQR
jgi:succinylarginine dihydrolase